MDLNTLLLIALACLILLIILRPPCNCHRDDQENFSTSRPVVSMTGINPIRQRARNYPVIGGEARDAREPRRGPYPIDSPYPPNHYDTGYHPYRNWYRNYYNTSPYYPPYDMYYENPYYPPTAESKGMYTSVYPDVCSRYGSSTMNVDPATYYMGSSWCQVGIASPKEGKDKLLLALEARFIGNSWSFRVRDNISQVYIYLNGVGNGPYGAYRDGDHVTIPGKEGEWKIQIQTNQNPYLLYLPQ